MKLYYDCFLKYFYYLFIYFTLVASVLASFLMLIWKTSNLLQFLFVEVNATTYSCGLYTVLFLSYC